ncbi:MAG: putative membrane protein YfcA, partial [Cocleimonas sp.]
MDSFTLIYIFTVFFASAFLKSLTGLGFSTICLGFLAAVLDIKLAILLVLLPSLSSNLLVMWQAGRFIEAFKRFWPLYLSAIPGLLLGIWYLGNSDNEIPKALLGALLILYGVWGLINGLMTLTKKQEKQLSLPVGFISGVANGVTGSQIMPIMPYLLSLKLDRD